MRTTTYGFYKKHSRPGFTLVELAVVVLIIAILIALTLPKVRSAGSGSERIGKCGRNLRQIEVALRCYAQREGAYPPASVADSDGRPIHSWRVLILPYLGQDELLARYRFDEPWDGPNNLKLLDEMPEVYRCSCLPAGYCSTTSYVAVLGKNCVYLDEKSPPSLHSNERPQETIAVAEFRESGVPWTAPWDFTTDRIDRAVNGPGLSISSRHPTGSNGERTAFVLLASGDVVRLPGNAEPTYIQHLLLRKHLERFADSDITVP